MNKKSSTRSLNRRQFLGTSATALAGITIVPSRVVSGFGYTAPSDTLNIACVGIGGMGQHVLRPLAETENIVALCDCDWNRATVGVFEQYPNAQRYKDYRVMLDRQNDIDAVVVATPDHTHAVVSMEAIRRGKHVYTEKPLTHTIYEARVLTEAAREHGVATQMGNLGQAGDGPRRLREMIQDDAIGPVTEVHVWTDRPNRGLSDTFWPQGVDRPASTPPIPDTLDWDLFIGPAPMRPYHRSYHPFNWRGWLDFGTGALGDIGCHAFDPVFRALDLKYPTSVQAVSTLINNETFPLGSIVTYTFPARGNMPPVRLMWYDGGLRPPRLPEITQGTQMGPNGVLYIGSKGVILGNRIFPESLRDAYEPPTPYIPSSPGHHAEWVQACKGGEPAGSNYEWAGPLTETVLLGNIALRLELREQLTRQTLDFDPVNLRIPSLAEANEFLHYEYRDGWTL